MKRPFDSLSGRSSPPSNLRRSARLRALANAGPSELHRPDDVPSARAPSSGLDASSARRAGVLPRPARAPTLTDLPPTAFSAITGPLEWADHANLALAHPRTLAPLVADELVAARIALAAENVVTLAHFESLLGAGAHAAADTVLSIEGWPRAEALKDLTDRLPALPEDGRFPAFALAAEAVHRVPADGRSAVIESLADALLDIPPGQRHDAWHALLPAIDVADVASDARLPLMTTWVGGIHSLQHTHLDDAAQTAFAALERLPSAQQVPVLLTLLKALAVPPTRVEQRTARAGFDAIARLPVESRQQPLMAMARLVASVAPGHPEAMAAPSERRAFLRTLRQTIAELPNALQPMPLASLASRIDQLPEHERHLEMHLVLGQLVRLAAAPQAARPSPDLMSIAMKALNRQISRLAWASRAAAWRSAVGLSSTIGRVGPLDAWHELMDQVERVEARRRPDMLLGAQAEIARLANVAEYALLLTALLRPRRLERQRDTYFHQGLAWANALPAEHRTAALCELADSIRELPPEAFGRATERLFDAVAAQGTEQRNAPFDALVEAVGVLVRNGMPRGFEVLAARIDALDAERRPPFVIALAQGLDHWPAEGQSDRFAALSTTARAFEAPDQSTVLVALADRVDSLLDGQRTAFMTLALAWAAGLPAEVRVAPYDRLAHTMDEVPVADRPGIVRQLLAAVFVLPDEFRLQAFHKTAETFGEMAADGRWPESFEPLLAAVAEQPVDRRATLLNGLIASVTLWPADRQPQRFAALRAQLPTLPPGHQAELLAALAIRLDTLTDDAQRREAAALREAIAQLPRLQRDALTVVLQTLPGEP